MKTKSLFKSLPLFTLTLIVSLAHAQSISVYRTNTEMTERLAPQPALTFDTSAASATTPQITIDDSQKFQVIDGIGASLTDSAAWLFSTKLKPEQVDAAYATLFSRKDGIALSFLRQPIGSSDLAVTFYSFDDLCKQDKKPCITPDKVTDYKLKHFSIAHDEAYIIPQLKKALAINPDLKIMITPWSPPGWMKSTGSMMGLRLGTKEPSTLRADAYQVYAQYFVKTIIAYESAGVPIYALSVQNEPLYAPENYSGLKMQAPEQAVFLGTALGPALAAIDLGPGKGPRILGYDHNWDRHDYPEMLLADPKAAAVLAGIAWHHYEGNPEEMTAFHKIHPTVDQWVTESSGGTWQRGNIFMEEATELVNVMRNWSKSYILWALATDEHHGPVVGGCDTCRGIVTIDSSNPAAPVVRPELDYYVLGHASKFIYPNAVRIASNEPTGTKIKDVAFQNPDGSIVLYTLNSGADSAPVTLNFHGKSVTTAIPPSTVATFVWK